MQCCGCPLVKLALRDFFCLFMMGETDKERERNRETEREKAIDVSSTGLLIKCPYTVRANVGVGNSTQVSRQG